MWSNCAKLIVYLQVRTVQVETCKNEIVNRLNKTKTEQTPDLKGGVYSVSYLLQSYLTKKLPCFVGTYTLFRYYALIFLIKLSDVAEREAYNATERNECKQHTKEKVFLCPLGL
jgi:hypothetical protein